MRKILVVIGLSVLLAGVFWPWLAKLPLGRLPGDIVIDRPGFKVYIPFATMLLISLLLSIIAWFFRK